MQSRLLRSFLVVAEKSNITEASLALNVSQPALTKSIHRLEDELKVKLFDRITSGVRLTPFGEILLQHVRIMENEYRHAQSRIEALRDGHAGELRIGAGPVWLVDILPPLLAQFQSAHPGIKISLIGGVIDTLVPAVINGDLDVICVSLDFPNRSEVIKVPLIDINHVLVADPSHPLLANTTVLEPGTANPVTPIKPGQLAGFPWLVLKSDYVGTERILSFHAANGLQPPTIALETTSIHSLMEMLHSGNYIAHIPSQLLSLARTKGLAELSINGTFWETTAGLVYRASLGLTGDTRSFIQQMQRHDFNAIAREET